MELLQGVLPWTQVILSVILVTAILLQQSGAGVGGAFGGGDGGSMHYTRRGLEKFLFRGTIILGILFVLASFTRFFV